LKGVSRKAPDTVEEVVVEELKKTEAGKQMCN